MNTHLYKVIASVMLFIVTSCSSSSSQGQYTSLCTRDLELKFEVTTIALHAWKYAQSSTEGMLVENLDWVTSQRDSTSCNFVLTATVNGKQQNMFKFFVDTKDMMIYADDELARQIVMLYNDDAHRRVQ